MTRLNTEQAAEYLGLAPQTLARWRSERKKGTPVFLKVGGNVQYRKEDLDAYLESRVVTPGVEKVAK